jgi:plastocyanin
MTLGLALVLLAAASPGQFSVVDDAFRPRTLTVGRGQAITWTWRGLRQHNVTFVAGPAPGRPAACSTRRSGRCTRRFPRAGRFDYVCLLHGGMSGRVTVRRR